MLISGESKASAAKAMFSGVITPQVPATLLQLHPDVTVLLDEAAAAEL
jgi:glucosamine-6-phosphate deaminase